MNRLQRCSSPQQKRQKLSESLTNDEHTIYNLIHRNNTTGIWMRDIKRETNLPTTVVNKSLKVLTSKSMIKEVTTIQNKGRKHYMAIEFEPSTEITGGDFYSEGELDIYFINLLRDICIKFIFKEKVATSDGCLNYISKNGIKVTEKQIEDILLNLVLDDEIMQMTSTGYGDFASFPVGRTCYMCKSKGGVKEEKKSGDLTSFPCFSCQRMSFCSPDNVVSPQICVYFQKWLDF